ncbi:MAG TPA: FG-GAP-like repeat-containing protein [Verrucomicrobiae bacterium]|nr:FG-GAP-like repeat-containing protein [Verrucomicrobiae bacterium]
MKPVEPNRANRRVAVYFFLVLAVILTPLFFAFWVGNKSGLSGDEFARVMSVGKNYYDKGEAAKAVEAFQKAVELQPTHPDALLNLANACLFAGRSDDALKYAQEVLNLDHNSAAAYYVAGCARVRLRKFEDAIKSLQPAKDLDRKVNAVSFQLGRAFFESGKFQEAAEQFEEIIQFEPEYPSANYLLSQALVRLGRTDEATQALQRHQQIQARKPAPSADVSFFERCVYTEARVPFQLEQPSRNGVKVAFVDATQEAFGSGARNYHGPIGVIDLNRRGANDVIVGEGEGGFRLLMSNAGRFQPHGEAIPGKPGAKYTRALVGDINNDRYEDVIVVGDQGAQLFKLATNGNVTDLTQFSRLGETPSMDGALVDLDFTGKLDLLLVTTGERKLRVLRNLGSTGGNPYFKDITQTSGVPASVSGIRQIAVDDWNGDDINDVFLTGDSRLPTLLTKLRGGLLTESNSPANWPQGRFLATGDLNNDLRTDVVIATGDQLECVFNGLTNRVTLLASGSALAGLSLVDYDNDGWLDICAHGGGVRVWRNLGVAGFRETTADLGLDKVAKGTIESFAAADFDGDGDTDLVLTIEKQGLQFLRNDGGNANRQLKLTLLGNRSNASGLGVRVEARAGRWRTIRTVKSLPIEIGVGRHPQLDSLSVRWFDASADNIDVKVDPKTPLPLIEIQFQATGSCPYLYAWDGKRFRFVTDLLGASPLGLPVTESGYVEADPDEFVWVGDETMFPQRSGSYVVQLTEELREVLYLDAAHLLVVDHPAGTEVYSTGKLVPGKPFPSQEIITLRHPYSLRKAERSDGQDVTAALDESDGKMASPAARRIPQLRGLAEPWSVTLDFGPLAVDRPLVLAMTGWLRFGGGMANIAASHHPDLPFPFPRLEVETTSGDWKAVDVVVGAPCGKTKSMVVDLTGKLPPGSRRLRLGTAFEIHWDRIALLERFEGVRTEIRRLTPDTADLHWRGYSESEPLPWFLPVTPDYERVRAKPNWRIMMTGWCTRYGDVRELIETRDNALALLNGGDELTLTFAADRLPPKPAGFVRDFFLYSSGWDKDADFHCKLGWLVEPLPWHGMNDQLYGVQPRPVIDGDWWVKRYNTRWVGPLALDRSETSGEPKLKKR